MRILICVLVILALSSCSVGKPKNQELYPNWEEYCRLSDNKIVARLDNELVRSAERVLNLPKIKNSVFIYSQHRSFYQSNTSAADTFLNTLCGEYRDNLPQLKIKLSLIAEVESPTDDPKEGDSQSLFSGNNYERLVLAMQAISADQIQENSRKYDVIAGVPDQLSIPPLSVCEFKFLQTIYLVENSESFDIKKYKLAWNLYRLVGKNGNTCTETELSKLVTFRGDGLLNPLSTEANSMIAESRMFAQNCKSILKANADSHFSDSDCTEYYRAPHYWRIKATRALLTTLLHFSNDSEQLLANSFNLAIFVRDEVQPIPPSILLPMLSGKSFKTALALRQQVFAPRSKQSGKSEDDRGSLIHELEQQYKSTAPQCLVKSLAGSEDLSSPYNLQLGAMNWDAWRRLAIAIDRHTDFLKTDYYNSKGSFLSTAYAPFSPTSYYINQSHKFTFKGYGGGDSPAKITDGGMNWMYILEVSKKDIFTGGDLALGKWPDFEHQWLDERTLGTSSHGQREIAWVKMGSPRPEEVKQLLWLGNLTVSEKLKELVSISQ